MPAGAKGERPILSFGRRARRVLNLVLFARVDEFTT
jgi:hypothetical protein